MPNPYDSAIKSGFTNHFVDQVFEFNQKVIGIGHRDIGLLSPQELAYAMAAMKEEATEFKTAHDQQDVIGAVDAVIDQMYFCIGFLARMGLTSEQVSACMGAVHTANMEKKLSMSVQKRVEGVPDAAKPEGWVGPEERIAHILGG